MNPFPFLALEAALLVLGKALSWSWRSGLHGVSLNISLCSIHTSVILEVVNCEQHTGSNLNKNTGTSRLNCPVIRMKGRDSRVDCGLKWLGRTSRRSRAVWTTPASLVHWRIGEDIPVGGQEEWLVWGWATGHTALNTVWEGHILGWFLNNALVKIQTIFTSTWYSLTWILHLRAFSASGNGEISAKILDCLPLRK